MKIYHYNPSTKEYLGSSEARQDPLDKDRFLIPVNSVIIPPISLGVNEECFFDTEWKIRKIKTVQPSLYHTWTDEEGWSITAENQNALDIMELEAEAERQAEAEAEAAKEAEQLLKAQAIIDNLPDWETVEKAIDAAFIDAKQNGIITKLARVVYWDIKNTEL